jgi:hypothetical protein
MHELHRSKSTQIENEVGEIIEMKTRTRAIQALVTNTDNGLTARITHDVGMNDGIWDLRKRAALLLLRSVLCIQAASTGLGPDGRIASASAPDGSSSSRPTGWERPFSEESQQINRRGRVVRFVLRGSIARFRKGDGELGCGGAKAFLQGLVHVLLKAADKRLDLLLHLGRRAAAVARGH